MAKYFLRPVCEKDYADIAAVYNSNPVFLQNHLGLERVDAAFAAEEAACMRKAGFCSCAIVNAESAKIQGILDYRSGQEAYLSLIMIDARLQGRGIGRSIYFNFEQQMRQAGSMSIRIDVVNDYPGSLVSYWKALGFSEAETISLRWGKKTSRAMLMRKRIQQ